MIKTFRFKIVFRVLLLTATLILLAFLIFKMDFIFVPLAVTMLALYQIYSLIYFTDRTNRDLSRFLLSIKYDDVSQAFTSHGLGSSFDELKLAFSEVMAKIQETRSEKEVHARYLNTIIQHVGIGLLAYKPDGTIDLMNNAAKKLLKAISLKNINDMKGTSPKLVETLFTLKHGDKRLVRIEREGETGYLSIFASAFVLREDEHILVSLQNIQEELEEREMEAWQNLIRVLTHEIMNSITPISSMSSTLLEMLVKDEKDDIHVSEKLDQEKIEEMTDALKVIHRRSQGLMDFVSAYRNMTLMPKPVFRIIALKDFLSRIETLMNNKIADNDIAFRWSVEPDTLELTADPGLMEQVIINLLLNSIDAVAGRDNPAIILAAFMGAEGQIMITVEDNGTGIVEEALEKIFIPFFTTKKHGSGIGLSISRQILRLHNATIRAQSSPDKKTIFTIRFS